MKTHPTLLLAAVLLLPLLANAQTNSRQEPPKMVDDAGRRRRVGQLAAHTVGHRRQLQPASQFEEDGVVLIPDAIHANVFHSIEELFKRSGTIRSRVQVGKLKVVGAIYDLKSGRVNWLGTHPKQTTLAARHR